MSFNPDVLKLETMIEENRRLKRWEKISSLIKELEEINGSTEISETLRDIKQTAVHGINWKAGYTQTINLLKETGLIDDDEPTLTLKQVAEICLDNKEKIIAVYRDAPAYGLNSQVLQLNQIETQVWRKFLFLIGRDCAKTIPEINKYSQQLETVFANQSPDFYRSGIEKLITKCNKKFMEELDKLLINEPDPLKLHKKFEELKRRSTHRPYASDKENLFLNKHQEIIDCLVRLHNVLERFSFNMIALEIGNYLNVLFDIDKELKELANDTQGWAAFKTVKNRCDKLVKPLENIKTRSDNIIDAVNRLSRDSRKAITEGRIGHMEMFSAFKNRINAEEKEIERLKLDIPSQTNSITLSLVTRIRNLRMLIVNGIEKETGGLFDDHEVRNAFNFVKQGDRFMTNITEFRRECEKSDKNVVDLLAGLNKILSRGMDTTLIFTEKTALEIKKRLETVINIVKGKLIPILEQKETRLSAFFEIPDKHDMQMMKVAIDDIRRAADLEKPSVYIFKLRDLVHRKTEKICLLLEINHMFDDRNTKGLQIIQSKIDQYCSDIKSIIDAASVYHERIVPDPSNLDVWLELFERFKPDTVSDKFRDRVAPVIQQYESIFSEQLLQLTFEDLKQHASYWKLFQKTSSLYPYMKLIAGECSCHDFAGYLLDNSPESTFFQRFLQFLLGRERWGLYIGLFEAVDKTGGIYKDYFGDSPEKKLEELISKSYNDFKDKVIYEAENVTPEELNAFQLLIPNGNDFKAYKTDAGDLEENLPAIQSLRQTMKRLKKYVGWLRIGEINLLKKDKESAENLGNLYPEILDATYFGNPQHIIPLELDIYKYGNELYNYFCREMEQLGEIGNKTDLEYSKILRKSLQGTLDKWNIINVRCRELASPQDENRKKGYCKEFYNSYISAWDKSDLAPLWRQKRGGPPNTLNSFFEMLKEVLEKHEDFLKITNSGGKGPDSSPPLDPFVKGHLKAPDSPLN